MVDLNNSIVQLQEKLSALLKQYAQLEKETLLQTRIKLGFLNDQDAFEWK